MAASIRNNSSTPRSVRLVLPAVVAGLAFAQFTDAAESARPRCTEDIVVNGDTVDANYKTNNIQLKNVVISQCDIRVAAKLAHATGLNFDNTRWTFEGDVHIDVENGSLRADEAKVDFRDGQISKAIITGKPAEFEQKLADGDQMARGHAEEIVYDVAGGTVTLTKDAWLSYGAIDMKNSVITYDIREQHVLGNSAPASQQVRIVIDPTKRKKEAPKPDPNAAGASPTVPPKTP